MVEPPKKAVALKRDKDTDGGVPRVVASGRGPLAEKILEIAKEHGVTIQQDSELVEVLEALEVDSLIPIEAYMAVAEIFAYVYRTNAEMRKKHKEMLHDK